MASQILIENKGEISTETALYMYVEWKVPENLLFLQHTEHRIHSPNFHFKDATWYLCLTMHAIKPRTWGGPNDSIDLYLVIKDPTTSTLCVNYHIGIKTVSGNTHRSHRGERIFEKDLTSWGMFDVLCRLDLSQQRICLGRNGVVTFFCYFWVETARNAGLITKLLEEQSTVVESVKLLSEDAGDISTETSPFMYVEWKVPEILLLSQDTKHRIQSPSFQFKDRTWYLQVTMNRRKFKRWDSAYGPVDLHLVIKDCAIPTLHVDYKIGIKTVDGNTYGIQRGEGVFDGNVVCQEWVNLLSRLDLIDHQIILAPNGVMTFFCYLRMESARSLDADSRMNMCEGTPKLVEDLKNLFLSGEDSDLNIKVKDTEFRVHKSILRARSSVFHSMFTHDMMEKNSGTVDIIDCEPEAFKVFLLYLYNGSMENLSTNIVFDLYKAADKYDTEELKLKCTEFIVSNLSVDTVCDIVVHALQYNEAELLKTAKEFFAKNFKSIILTTKWQSFLIENPVAANELFIIASENCIIRDY